MNKLLIIFFLFFLTNCSLDTKSGIWTDKKKILIENKKITKVFKTKEILENELNATLKIRLKSKSFNNSLDNNTNNNGRINFNGNLKNISKFKFSKISNFKLVEPELVFDQKNLFFFDDKGSIIKFDTESKIIWKKNYYTKQEKKLKPKPIMKKDNTDILVIADNISKFYALNMDTGELLWSKNNLVPFNSQIKVYKDKFFVVDFNNILRCYSIKNGEEIWKVKAGDVFIKSEKKLSVVVVQNVVYFNNSSGDITAVDINNGNLLWQIPTQGSTIYEDAFFLKTSDIVANNEMIIFSNNKNEFYSIDIEKGLLKWKQSINSSIRSTIINDLIFIISNEGFLVLINSSTGEIIRITDIFNVFKNKNRKKINPIGFIVGLENIYLTTDNGKLLVIDITTGKTHSVIKIDNDTISRPFVLNQNLFIIKENSIIKLN